MNTKSFTYYAERAAALAMAAGITWLIMIMATAPDPYEDTAGGGACITDDAPEYVAFGTPYDELFPAGHEYGKDGEIIGPDSNAIDPDVEILLDTLPGPTAHPSTTPDGHIDHPISPWIQQSITGQSPPILYWPAPKRVLKQAEKPCTDRYKPVAEPGILALIGAALLAAGIMR